SRAIALNRPLVAANPIGEQSQNTRANRIGGQSQNAHKTGRGLLSNSARVKPRRAPKVSVSRNAMRNASARHRPGRRINDGRKSAIGPVSANASASAARKSRRNGTD